MTCLSCKNGHEQYFSVVYCGINHWSLTSEVCICETSGKHLQLNLLLCTCTQVVIYSSMNNTKIMFGCFETDGLVQEHRTVSL